MARVTTHLAARFRLDLVLKRFRPDCSAAPSRSRYCTARVNTGVEIALGFVFMAQLARLEPFSTARQSAFFRLRPITSLAAAQEKEPGGVPCYRIQLANRT